MAIKRRMHFDQLFATSNGMVTPKVSIHINGITMGPGVSFGGGVSFSGIDLTKYIGKYFEVITHPDGTHEITGAYD